MAENWPWESSSGAPPTSSTQTSPLQSGSSQSSHEATAVAAAEFDRPATLVETLRTCLANAAPTEPVAVAGRSDPLRQPLRGSPSRTGMKRRSRASRRVPTTVVEATCSDFRETVHRLTGIPTPTPVSAPVRPQPQRAFIRPPSQTSPRVPPAPRPQVRNSPLHITEAPPPLYPPTFWDQQPHLDPNFVKSEAAEGFEPGIGGSSQSTLASTMSQLMSASSGSIQTWWDPVPQPQPQSQSRSFLMNPSTTTGPFDSSGTSGAGPSLQDDFDDWFHQDHSGSDYMR